MFVVGLTGSLKTGKSTVAAMLAKLGAKVVSADTLAHKQICPSGVCHKPIVKAFGEGVLTKGIIDRKKLAGVVQLTTWMFV